MKIIQANKFYFPRGGAERYLFDLSDWLQAQGHDVIPFAMQHPDNRLTPWARFFPSYVSTERVAFRPSALKTVGRMFFSLEVLRKMSRLIQESKPAICHVHNLYTQLSPSVLYALREANVPIVMTVHDHHLLGAQYNLWAPGCGENVDGLGMWRAAARRFHKNSYAASFAQAAAFAFHRRLRVYERFVDRFIVPSQYLAERLVSAGFSKDRLRVIPHGIHPDWSKPTFGHRDYVLFVGRLSEEKGVEMILKIAETLPKETFVIVGDGPKKTALHEAAQGLSNIEFVGSQYGEALQQYYQGAKVLLVPSRVHEVFPLVVLEAMRAGTPVIASRVGGIPEVVEEGKTGLLVDPNDVAGWIQAVRTLSSQEDRRRSMALAAREAIEGRFNSRQHFAEVWNVYEEVLKSKDGVI